MVLVVGAEGREGKGRERAIWGTRYFSNVLLSVRSLSFREESVCLVCLRGRC